MGIRSGPLADEALIDRIFLILPLFSLLLGLIIQVARLRGLLLVKKLDILFLVC